MGENFEKDGYYTEGNTVRHMETMPDYRQERIRREQQEREAELKRKKRIARRNQERVLRMSRSYVMFLIMGVLVFGVFAGLYIKIQSSITARMIDISNLESEVADLKAENDEAFKRMNTIIDLETVKNTAIQEYGMFYASKDQVIYYTVENDDYMNQYVEIPEE